MAPKQPACRVYVATTGGLLVTGGRQTNAPATTFYHAALSPYANLSTRAFARQALLVCRDGPALVHAEDARCRGFAPLGE